MYTDDKILKGGEITAAGAFSRDGNLPFYIFLTGRSEEAPVSTVMDAILKYGKSRQPFPLTVGMWNPVVFESVTVTSETLSSYRIFWGAEE